MSVFTSKNQKTLEVPGTDPVRVITIRQVSPKHLEEANRIRQREGKSELRELFEGLGEGVTQLVESAIKERAKAEEAAPAKPSDPAAVIATLDAPDPLAGFDKATLIARGVVSWTFEEMAWPTAIEHDQRVAIANDMAEDTRDWLAREILRWTKPTLFLTEAEKEAARKNG